MSRLVSAPPGASFKPVPICYLVKLAQIQLANFSLGRPALVKSRNTIREQ